MLSIFADTIAAANKLTLVVRCSNEAKCIAPVDDANNDLYHFGCTHPFCRHCIAQLRIGRNTFAQCPLCQLPLMIKDESSFRSLNDVRQRAVDLYRALTCQMDGNYSQEQLNETLRIMHENAPQRTVDDFKKECQLKIDDDNTVTPKIAKQSTPDVVVVNKTTQHIDDAAEVGLPPKKRKHSSTTNVTVVKRRSVQERQDKVTVTKNDVYNISRMDDSIQLFTEFASLDRDNKSTEKEVFVKPRAQPIQNKTVASAGKRSRSDPIKKSASRLCRFTAQNALDQSEMVLDVAALSSKTRSAARRRTTVATTATTKPVNRYGDRPLGMAAAAGNLAKVVALLKNGANPNTIDNAGWTPLHEAAYRNASASIIATLINNGALVNVPGDECQTPLHRAVIGDAIDCVRELIAHGADPLLVDIFGRTPVYYAKHDTIRQLLMVTSSIPTIVNNKIDLRPSPLDHVAFSVGLTPTIACKGRNLIERHGGSVGVKLTDATTHLICTTDANRRTSRTEKLAEAMVRGIWIISSEWINECDRRHKLVPVDNFEITGLLVHSIAVDGADGGATRSRIARMQMRPRLFVGCQFYLCNHAYESPLPTRDVLRRLIELGGGKLLSREPCYDLWLSTNPTLPYYSNGRFETGLFMMYVPGERLPTKPYADKRIAMVTPIWLLDCIGRFELCPSDPH